MRARALSFLALVSLVGAAARADDRGNAPLPPRVCISFDPVTREWGRVGSFVTTWGGRCAPGFAFMAVIVPPGPQRDGSLIPVVGDCCPLPEGVLTGEEMEVDEECPEGWVGAGGRTEPHDESVSWYAVRHYMLCRKIDSRRFILGPPTGGRMVGTALELAPELLAKSRGVNTSVIHRSSIPPALRFGIARLSRWAWTDAACMGLPFGSLLTAKVGATCDQQLFRELQYAGIAGDPPRGTPVAVIPSCTSLADPLDPATDCAD